MGTQITGKFSCQTPDVVITRVFDPEPPRGCWRQAAPNVLTTDIIRFLDDGRIDLDNNAVERATRPLALTHKNALFAGSDEGGDNWAVIATLIENCKLTGINPHTWLTATLTSLANGHPASRIDEILPHAHAG